MPRYRTAYPAEFRRQMVDLVRSGRTREELAREFEPTAPSISTWVKQAERDAGKRVEGPTSAEREELGCLRRENHRLRQERNILAPIHSLKAHSIETQAESQLFLLLRRPPRSVCNRVFARPRWRPDL
jgi:transposase